MVAALGILRQAIADEPAPAAAANPPQDAQAVSDVSNAPPENLEPMVVKGYKLPGILGKLFGYSWNVSEAWGSNFHIRGGQIVDAIGFRHAYLEQHPGEKAVVVVVTRPPNPRVTQAVVAYTAAGKLHLESVAIGDIVAGDLTAADIDHPDVIRKYVEDIRDSYLMDLGFPKLKDAQDLSKDIDIINNPSTAAAEIPDLGANQAAAAQSALASAESMALMQDLKFTGSVMAQAEETGDYSNVLVATR